MTARKLHQHDVTLHGNGVVLRPMTEDDWDVLVRWNSDPEILWLSEGDDVQSYSLAEVQGIYRSVSKTAFCFIAEVGEHSVGECWLQQMNLQRVLDRYPGKDARRIDLMLGDKALWGQGYGTEMIRLLTRFGFERECADLIFGCSIADYNARSLRAFMKNGYRIDSSIRQPAGMKAQFEQDVVLSREEYVAERDASADG